MHSNKLLIATNFLYNLSIYTYYFIIIAVDLKIQVN